MENQTTTMKALYPAQTRMTLEGYVVDGLLIFPAMAIAIISFAAALWGFYRSSSGSHRFRVPLLLGSFIFVIALSLNCFEQMMGKPVTLRYVRVMYVIDYFSF
jgi:hypothetical protein